MTKTKAIRLTARTLSLAFALFISIFSFDVFEESKGCWNTTAAFLIHNIPTGVLLVVLWISWKREWVGGLFYPAFGCLYIYWAWGRFPFSVYALIAGPLLLTGILFAWAWKRSKTIPAPPES